MVLYEWSTLYWKSWGCRDPWCSWHRCVARDLHTIVSRPLERTCWRQFAAQWGDCKKSRIGPLNAIIIMTGWTFAIHCGLIVFYECITVTCVFNKPLLVCLWIKVDNSLWRCNRLLRQQSKKKMCKQYEHLKDVGTSGPTAYGKG